MTNFSQLTARRWQLVRERRRPDRPGPDHHRRVGDRHLRRAARRPPAVRHRRDRCAPRVRRAGAAVGGRRRRGLPPARWRCRHRRRRRRSVISEPRRAFRLVHGGSNFSRCTQPVVADPARQYPRRRGIRRRTRVRHWPQGGRRQASRTSSVRRSPGCADLGERLRARPSRWSVTTRRPTSQPLVGTELGRGRLVGGGLGGRGAGVVPPDAWSWARRRGPDAGRGRRRARLTGPFSRPSTATLRALRTHR